MYTVKHFYTISNEETLVSDFMLAHTIVKRTVFFVDLYIDCRVKRLMACAFIRDFLAMEVAEGRSSKTIFDKVIDAAERYADGIITLSDLGFVFNDTLYMNDGFWETPVHSCYEDCDVAVIHCSEFAIIRRGGPNESEALKSQVAIIFDMVAPVDWVFNPNWRTDTAVNIAKNMYESKDFSAMPIIADALQDAGCEQEDLLTRMRDPSKNWYRGNWVVDHLLGKR